LPRLCWLVSTFINVLFFSYIYIHIYYFKKKELKRHDATIIYNIPSTSSSEYIYKYVCACVQFTSGLTSAVLALETNSLRKPSSSVPSMYPLPVGKKNIKYKAHDKNTMRSEKSFTNPTVLRDTYIYVRCVCVCVCVRVG